MLFLAYHKPINNRYERRKLTENSYDNRNNGNDHYTGGLTNYTIDMDRYCVQRAEHGSQWYLCETQQVDAPCTWLQEYLLRQKKLTLQRLALGNYWLSFTLLTILS